jgi:hypothetical protein
MHHVALPRIAFILATAALSVTFTSLASADALPPDTLDCQGGGSGQPIGTPCNVEGQDRFSGHEGPLDGTCQTSTCTSAAAGCVFAAEEAGTDAAACTSTYACERCIPNDGGVASSDGGASSDAGNGASGDSGANGGSGSSSSSSGCAVTTGAGIGQLARAGAPLLLAALVPLFLRRRRRAAERDRA